jgi:hypothetical protein
MGQAVELEADSLANHDQGAVMLPRNTVNEAGGRSYSVPCSALIVRVAGGPSGSA